MAYTVEFSARANRDIDEIVARIQADAPIRATQWRQKLHTKLLALITFPESGGLAAENDEARTKVRQIIYGRYRALYIIRGETIYNPDNPARCSPADEWRRNRRTLNLLFAIRARDHRHAFLRKREPSPQQTSLHLRRF